MIWRTHLPPHCIMACSSPHPQFQVDLGFHFSAVPTQKLCCLTYRYLICRVCLFQSVCTTLSLSWPYVIDWKASVNSRFWIGTVSVVGIPEADRARLLPCQNWAGGPSHSFILCKSGVCGARFNGSAVYPASPQMATGAHLVGVQPLLLGLTRNKAERTDHRRLF